MPVLIGTSGWQYESWRRRFHDGVPQRRWFEHTMAAFRTVELNVTFYRLPSHETFAGWHRRSPDDAVITVKASRYLTHIRRLRDPAEPVERLLSRADGLGEKLGPILVQLPPDMRADIPALATALDAFGRHRRVAVETRHESWWTEPVCASLAERGVAHVWADRGGEAQGPTWRTAPWGYVRLHHGDAQPPPNYERATLRAWADRIAAAFGRGDDVFVYFNNDPRCAAVDNAMTFAEEVERAGLVPTRVPAMRPGSWT
jgi:uncharacterized protein YecE (DUF72 family)